MSEVVDFPRSRAQPENSEATPLKLRGLARDGERGFALTMHMNRRPTEAELQFMYRVLRQMSFDPHAYKR